MPVCCIHLIKFCCCLYKHREVYLDRMMKYMISVFGVVEMTALLGHHTTGYKWLYAFLSFR